MSYSYSQLNKLGRIVANHSKKNISDIYSEYEAELYYTISKSRDKRKIINALWHIFWYFKKTNTSWEKQLFLESLQVYKEGRIPMSSIVLLLRSWAMRDEREYILKQSILYPFPDDLIDLSQSGKHVDI